MDGDVRLMKLIPSMDASLLDYMAEHYDAVIIESFGWAACLRIRTGLPRRHRPVDRPWKDRHHDHPGHQ